MRNHPHARRTALGAVGSAVATALLVPTSHAAVDTTPPTVNLTLRDPDAYGWHNHAVPVHLMASDASGIDERSTVSLSGATTGAGQLDDRTPTADWTIKAEGRTTISWDVVDRAGNHARGSREIALDTIAPSMTLNAPEDGTDLFTGSTVEVGFGGRADLTSGLGPAGVTGDVVEAGGTWYLKTETPGQKSVTWEAWDNAGNVKRQTRSYLVSDYVQPTVTLSTATAPNAAGWFGAHPDVVMHGTAGSAPVNGLMWEGGGKQALIPSADAVLTWKDEGRTELTVRATDTSNHVGAAARISLAVDTVSPTARIDDVAARTGERVVPPFSCSDATSGITSCVLSGDVVAGALDTRSAGVRRVTVTATDRAGHVQTAARTFTVTPALARAVSATTVKAKLTKRRATASIRVSSAVAATGTVDVLDGARLVGRGTLVDGAVAIRTSKLKRGKHRLTVVYGGSAAVLPSTTAFRLRVR